MADILEWILEQAGESDVKLTSFSISEEFIRRMYHIRRKHRICGLSLLLDHKATIKTLMLWHFMANVYENVYLSSNHSKIMIVRGEYLSAAVVSSQNLTRGNRHESTIITTDPGIIASLEAEYDHLITTKSVRLNDLLNRATQSDRGACRTISSAG